MLVVFRVLAVVAALGFGALAALRPSQADLFALLAVEVLVFGLVFPLFGLDLERLVAVRYLRRSQPPRVVRIALVISMTTLALGFGLLLTQHGRHRTVETAGVVLVFAAGLATAVCLLLHLFSIFTAVSTLGVALGVAALVVVSAVTGGFEREFQRSVFAVNGHLIVASYGNPSFKEAEEEARDVEKKLGDLPGLTSIERFGLSSGEVMIGKVGANLKGIDFSRGSAELRRALTAGSLDDLGRPATCQAKPTFPGETPPAPTDAARIVLGGELAHKLRVKVGDCVTVVVPFSAEGSETPPAFPFKVVGLFHFGFNEYDTRLAYVRMSDAQLLAEARQFVLGVELRFTDPMIALRMDDEVSRRLGTAMHILDWKTLNGNIFAALSLQKIVISIVLAFIIVVAAFNIVASLTLVVLSKVREIAILGSMGARQNTVLRIFLVAGATVGAVGAGLGVGLGLLVCALLHRFGYVLDAKVYNIERLPVVVSPVEILLVVAVALGICVVFTLFPAVRAARLRPLDGLRYD